jgi:hypothetical protein
MYNIKIDESDNLMLTKEYFNISNNDINRILESYLFLSNLNIGPKVYHITIEAEYLSISMEKVDHIILNNDIKSKILNIIKILHSHDYYHGNLILSNIGIKNNKIMILNPDNMIHISMYKNINLQMDYIYLN